MLRRKQEASVPDYRGMPTHACPCGEQIFIVKCMFTDYEISLYALDAECSGCGALLTVPCLVDKEQDA